MRASIIGDCACSCGERDDGRAATVAIFAQVHTATK